MTIKNIPLDCLELVNGDYHSRLSPAARAKLAGFIAALILFPFVSLIFIVGNIDIILSTWEKMSVEQEEIPKLILWSVLLLVTSFLVVVKYIIGKRNRIYIDGSGIYFRSGLPEYLDWLKLDWDMAWTDIKAVERDKLFRNNNIIYVNIRSISKYWRVTPLSWVKKDEIKMIDGDLFKKDIRADEQLEKLMNSHLIQHLEKHGIVPDLELAEGNTVATFSLEKNIYTKISIAIFVVIGSYAFIDAVLFDESYPEVKHKFEVIWGVTGVICGVILTAWLYLKKSTICSRSWSWADISCDPLPCHVHGNTEDEHVN